ncbi:MAG: M23 family metallopeptidase, partial [Candidatus Gracilibacteria bacterium]|nr:M23 family metallopeptidase [Candidatus Gracilibacteria bacterium]
MRKTIIGFLFLISLTTIQTSAADTSFTFPLPAGDNKLTNNKAGHEGYLGWTPNFKVDFQVAEIPDNIKTSETVSRCYTYGAPILAAKQGTVLKAVSTGERHTTNPDFGAYVVIKHDDGSKAYYGHMITNTNDKYVSTGEKVEKGQILGLMGDTGYILSKYENNPCEKDEKNENFGTHLHFETRDLFDAAGNSTTPEPLGRPENKDFKVNSTYISDTIPYDPTNAYVKNHAGKYPYVLQMEEVHWITPLQVASGSNATFTVKGNHFSKQTNLQLSFCKSQTWKITDEHTATVSCGVSNETGLKETLFANSTAGGELKVQVDLQTNPSGNPSISEVNFIPPKPGEFIDFTILGKNLPGTLHIVVRDQEDRTEQGACDTTGQFSFLSPGKIQSRCRIPLNLGPVETHSERNFMVTMYSSEEAMLRNETPLYSNQFDISYGISSANLEPRKAIYYTPTRFTITGKNVHRTTIFFIEGCKDLKTIGETSYEQITFECFLQRLPGAPVPPQQGETQRHLFLFKTESKFDKNGKQIYTEAEDEAHVILSGYIDVTYDLTTHVDSIEPNEALEGIDTLFTIQGNNLPYSDGNETKPLVWLENCPGTGGENRIQIVPDSYTPYGFDFQCNPQFTAEEKTEYKTLETQYDTPDREKKKTLWPQFETFFDSLKPRSLHVKQQTGTQDKEFLSEQTVRLISALYNDIKNEESFQFDYTREDGNYDTSGIAIVSSLQAGSITRSNRRQIITVQGENLSYETLLKSDDCAQIAVKYGSSAKFEFVCLLKKVSVAEYQVVDSSKGNELHKKSIDIREVYDVTVKDSPEKGFLHIFVTGVNLEKTTLASSTNCKTLTILHAPSTSELTFLCEENFGSFSKPDKISLQISSQDNFPLFNSSVPIGEELKFSSPTPMSLINNPTSPGNPTIPNTTNIPGNPSTSGEMTPLTDLLTVDCGKIPNNELFIGECKVYSNFMREGHGTFSLDMPNLIAAIDASFDVTLSKQLDQQTSIMPSGLRINPMSGKGLVIVDMKNANMLINGEFKGLGFEVQDVLGYPFDFDLYDFNGQFVAGIPSFSLSQSRADSALVIGIGEVSGPQIVKLKGRGKEIQEAIEKEIAKLNKDLNQKKIELGAKLVGSIENSTLKKLARVSYIKILKALEIVPEEIAFFDNFDLVAKGKLKSEPFRPKSWGENQAWILE